MAPRKKTRRGNGEGTVFQLPIGRWRADGQATNPLTGTTKTLSRTGSTQKEALERRNAAIAEVEGRTDQDGVTVGKVLDGFIERFERRVNKGGTGAPTMGTLNNYRWAITHITPALGNVLVANLKAGGVDDFLIAKEKSGLGGSSVNRLRSVMAQAFKEAQKREEILRNPAELSDSVAVPVPRKRALTDDEVEKLLAAAEGHRLEPVIRTQLALGLRPGEVLTLKWSDWDREIQTIHVQRSFQGDGRGKLWVGSVKTPRSNRVLPVPRDLAATLIEHESSQNMGSLEGYMFTTATGTLFDESNYRGGLARLAAKAKIGHVTPHELQHTLASGLMRSKAQPRVVADILGHSNPTITMGTYQHVTTADMRDALTELHG